jgi:hypothetical protein
MMRTRVAGNCVDSFVGSTAVKMADVGTSVYHSLFQSRDVIVSSHRVRSEIRCVRYELSLNVQSVRKMLP